MPNEQNGYCGPHSSRDRSAERDDDSMRYQRRPGEHLMRGPYLGPIPRIRTKNMQQMNEQYDDCSPTVRQKRSITRLDTFRENAIETIYDEFRFLDEPDTPSPASSANPIVTGPSGANEATTSKKRFTLSLVAYCLLPLIQLTLSLGLILLAILRLRELFQEPFASKSLVDFNKPEGQFPIEEGSSRTLKIRSAIAVMIPAAFQILAAIAGFWPLVRENRKFYQCFHITFSTLAVLQWLPSVDAVAVEINQSFVQTHEWYQMSSHLIYVILLCAATFGAIILPSITLCIAATQILSYSRQLKRDVVGVCLALATSLTAATMCCFSGFASSRTLTNVTQWKSSPAVANQSALYSFALKEVITAGYVLLSSVFFFVAAIQRNQNVVIASAIIQVIDLLALGQLLTPSRLAAVLLNSRVLSIDNGIYPVTQVNHSPTFAQRRVMEERETLSHVPFVSTCRHIIRVGSFEHGCRSPSVVLLYAFILALLFMISVQFIATIISLRSHSTTTASAPTLEYPQQRTSF